MKTDTFEFRGYSARTNKRQPAKTPYILLPHSNLPRRASTLLPVAVRSPRTPCFVLCMENWIRNDSVISIFTNSDLGGINIDHCRLSAGSVSVGHNSISILLSESTG